MAPAAHDPVALPADLPAPVDDGACLHLRGLALPDISLEATDGTARRLATLPRTILFAYPRTGVPGQPPSLGFQGESWDSIPGARGCTPQCCGFRDLAPAFASLGVTVLGLSTNTSDHQREFKARAHIPFEFLSDHSLSLTRTCALPTFEFPVESGGPTTLLRRLAMYIEPDETSAARISHVWYPVFPPNAHAACVHEWLRQRASIRVDPITPVDRDFVVRELHHHWHATTITSRGVAFDAAGLPGFIARRDGQPVGLLTMSPGADEIEVVTLSSRLEGLGIGARLLDAAERHARTLGRARVFLTTTNDNSRALRFYQRRGWRLAALHKGEMDRARAMGHPVPVLGHDGVPCRDELELEYRFTPK